MNNQLKRIAIVLVFTSIASIGISQGPNPRIEFSGGVNSFSVRGNPVVDDYYRPRSSSVFGLGLVHQLNRTFSLGAKIQYENCINDLYNVTASDSEYFGLFNLKYLNLPVLVEMERGNASYIYIRSGINLGILLGKTVYTLNSQGQILDYTGTSISNANLGIYTGIGGSVKVWESINAFLEINNNLGITDIVSDLDLEDSFRSNSIRFELGIQYSFFH